MAVHPALYGTRLQWQWRQQELLTFGNPCSKIAFSCCPRGLCDTKYDPERCATPCFTLQSNTLALPYAALQYGALPGQDLDVTAHVQASNALTMSFSIASGVVVDP